MSTPVADPRFESRYDVQEEIGRGGTAVVYRVFDRILDRHVAMKVLRSPSDHDALDALRDEARTVARLDHPNIVPIYDVLADGDRVTTRILMKLVEGRSLAAVIKESPTPPVVGLQLQQLLQVFIKVCDAVAFAHSRGVIHRDLTPANVMVGSFGRVYVMDWGLAVFRDAAAQFDASSSPTTVSGTLAYMAPEQADGRLKDIGPATDVFGLGGILYHLLTLGPPWRGATANEILANAHAGRVPPPVPPVAGLVLPTGLCRIATKALATDPRDRHASVEALRHEVETFLHAGGWFDVATFPRGTVILREDEPGMTAYIIVSGSCEIYRTVDGKRHHLRSVGPGDVFGEVAFFAESRRTASVEAVTDVSALVVTRDTLERELEQTSWMRAFVRAAVERFLELDRLESSRPT